MSAMNEEAIDRLRQRVGSIVNAQEEHYLTEVSRDSARHWAWATGDRSRIYIDGDWARQHGYSDVIAPPTMLYAFARGASGYNGGLPGVHSVFGGSHWKWNRPLAVGTQISPKTVFTGIRELDGRFAGRMLKQEAETTFIEESGAQVAVVNSWSLRYERASAQQRNLKPMVEKSADSVQEANAEECPKLTQEDIQEITAAYKREAIEAATVRRWASIEVQELLPTMIRGPYSSTCAVAFEQAWGGAFIRTHGYWYEFLERHPQANIKNEQGVPESPEAVHWDAKAARRAGVAAPYDFGAERIAWLATFLTNWGGPTSFLSELWCEVRSFNTAGSILTCSGVVVSKEIHLNTGRARVSFEARNQSGRVTAIGWGILEFRDVITNFAQKT